MAESEIKTEIRPATNGQYKDLFKQAFDAVPPELSFDSAENMLANGLLDDLKKVYAQYTVSGEVRPNKILKRISVGKKITIKALDGSRTITHAGSTFKSGIDSDFKDWGLNTLGNATPAIDVEIHEVKVDATFKKVFNSFACVLQKLVMTQDQIIEFCETQPDLLREHGYATFFLMQHDDGRFFIARVYVSAAGLCVRVYGLGDASSSYDSYRHRVVVPLQLASLIA